MFPIKFRAIGVFNLFHFFLNLTMHPATFIYLIEIGVISSIIEHEKLSVNFFQICLTEGICTIMMYSWSLEAGFVFGIMNFMGTFKINVSQAQTF